MGPKAEGKREMKEAASRTETVHFKNKGNRRLVEEAGVLRYFHQKVMKSQSPSERELTPKR